MLSKIDNIKRIHDTGIVAAIRAESSKQVLKIEDAVVYL